MATNVLVFRALNGRTGQRLGQGAPSPGGVGGSGTYEEFLAPFGLVTPGQVFAMLADLMFVLDQFVVNRLLDGFEGNLTTMKWATLTKTSHDTALRDIQDLIDHGILKKAAGGGRSTSYALA